MTKTQNSKPDIRYLDEMREILYDKEWLKTAPNLELYFMYRGVKPQRKASFLRGKEKDLRYDITVIPPRMLGREFVKTKGHEHSSKYQELYIVLDGEGIFLMQKQKDGVVEDVFALKVKRGQAVIVPPGYGHITINPSKKELKAANWISKKCQNKYDLFEKMKGACYYYTKSGWLKNKNYQKVPELRFKKPLKSIPKNLDFLK